jgi:hypothetical protein
VSTSWFDDDWIRITFVTGGTVVDRPKNLMYIEPSSIKSIDHDPVLTIDEKAEILDSDAENDNYHSLVGAHTQIASKLSEFAGPEVAERFIDWLAERNGLHGSW